MTTCDSDSGLVFDGIAGSLDALVQTTKQLISQQLSTKTDIESLEERLTRLEKVLSFLPDQFVKSSAFDMLEERLSKVEKAKEDLSGAAHPRGHQVGSSVSISDKDCDHIEALQSEEEKAAAELEVGSLEQDIEVKDPSQSELPQTVEISPPEDIHYLSAFMTLQDERLDSRIAYSCFTLIIVLLQLISAISLVVTMGNFNGLCFSHDECGRAKWCTVHPHPRLQASVGAGRCLYCVSDSNDLCWLDGTAKNEVLWATQQDSFGLATRSSLPRSVGYHLSEEDHKAMCSKCIGNVAASRGIPSDIITANLEMGVREWMVFIFISFMASGLIANEASEWYKNVIMLHRAQPTHWHSALNHDRANCEDRGEGLMLGFLPQSLSDEFACQHKIWKIKYVGLQAIQDLRSGALGTILVNVPSFIMLGLSDPVSILVNAIATFFILEVDDLFFTMHPAENHPVRAWTTLPMHITLEDANRIEKVKLMYFLGSMFALACMKPLGAAWGVGYLYVPVVLLNACALISELMLCHTWRTGCTVALRWFSFGFVCFWLINVVWISLLPDAW